MDFSLAGLPPLPRSLRSLLNFNSHQLREMGRAHVLRARIQRQQQHQGTPEKRHHFNSLQPLPQQRLPSPPAGWSSNNEQSCGGLRLSTGQRSSVYNDQDPVLRLETKMALLRREMMALRQTDMSLLCQLWCLNEMMQDMKQNGELEELFDEEALESAEAQQAYLEYREQLHEYNQLLEKHQASFREAGSTFSDETSTSSDGAHSALGSPDK